jgi:hypothetical protein
MYEILKTEYILSDESLRANPLKKFGNKFTRNLLPAKLFPFAHNTKSVQLTKIWANLCIMLFEERPLTLLVLKAYTTKNS